MTIWSGWSLRRLRRGVNELSAHLGWAGDVWLDLAARRKSASRCLALPWQEKRFVRLDRRHDSCVFLRLVMEQRLRSSALRTEILGSRKKLVVARLSPVALLLWELSSQTPHDAFFMICVNRANCGDGLARIGSSA